MNNEADVENAGESSHAADGSEARGVTHASRRSVQGRENRENLVGHDAENQASYNVNRNPNNERDQEDYLVLIERPDQAEGLHPFTANVMRAPMSENKVPPMMEKYGGLMDLVKHLRCFIDAMVVYSSDELVW